MTEVTAFPFGTPTRSVKFQGVDLTVIPGADADSTLVAVKQICEHLGIDRRAQQRWIQANYPRERWGYTALPSAGGPQQTFCIALSHLGLWLASIEVNKVRADRQEALRRFQERCAQVIYQDLFGPAATEAGQLAVGAVLPAGHEAALWAEVRRLNARLEQQEAASTDARFRRRLEYERNRAFADRHLPTAKALLRRHVAELKLVDFVEAPEDLDLDEVSDLIPLLAGDRRVACRIRASDRAHYARNGDFTLRLTELPKIRRGYGHFYFFGVARDDADASRGLYPWTILDLEVFRRAGLNGKLREGFVIFNTLEYNSPIVVAHEGWGEASWRTRVRLPYREAP